MSIVPIVPLGTPTLTRGQQRLAKAVKALCKIITDNPDVVNPDANPLRKSVYTAVTAACDAFNELIPSRVPTGTDGYANTAAVYSDGTATPNNFDHSGGKYIVRVHDIDAGVDLDFAIRIKKVSTDPTADMPEVDFLLEVASSWSMIGQSLVNLYDLSSTAKIVAVKRNVQGHLVDAAVPAGLATYTSTVSHGADKLRYLVTTITYKDQNGAQDRIQMPGTYLALGKVKVEGDLTSTDPATHLVGALSDTDSEISTRAGGATINPVMAFSTISNARLYRKFYATL